MERVERVIARADPRRVEESTAEQRASQTRTGLFSERRAAGMGRQNGRNSAGQHKTRQDWARQDKTKPRSLSRIAKDELYEATRA